MVKIGPKTGPNWPELRLNWQISGLPSGDQAIRDISPLLWHRFGLDLAKIPKIPHFWPHFGPKIGRKIPKIGHFWPKLPILAKKKKVNVCFFRKLGSKMAHFWAKKWLKFGPLFWPPSWRPVFRLWSYGPETLSWNKGLDPYFDEVSGPNLARSGPKMGPKMGQIWAKKWPKMGVTILAWELAPKSEVCL
jgi:hypothetical protein